MFVADDPHRFIGQTIGNGHCVPLVQQIAGVPHTSHWRRGVKVRGSEVPFGTVIATFDLTDRYANATDGSSHVAVLLKQLPEGLRVFDQWLGQPAHSRTVRFRGGEGKPANDGDAYHVVVTE